MTVSEDIAKIREDVAYIRAKVEVLPDHEQRIRKVERRQHGVLGTTLTALLAALGIHLA